MGSPIYDFLLDSFLFDEDRLETSFRGESDAALERELDLYRQYCIDHSSAMEQEIRNSPALLRMVHRGDLSIRLLKQASLYVQQFIVDDPLFTAAYRQPEGSRAFSTFAGISEQPLNRERVVRAIRQLKDITPMVVGDYARVLPLSKAFEGPERLPFYVGDGGADTSELVRWLRPRARVLAIEEHEGTLRVHPPKPNLAPRDQIAVEFEGAEEDSFMAFLYSTMELDSGRADSEVDSDTLPIELRRARPSREEFQAWVDQSISRTADVFQKQVMDEARIAATLRASQIVRSPLAFDLLERVYGISPDLQSDVAANLIKMELPFLANLSVREIMSVRRDHAEAFENWRIELERQLRNLAALKDPSAIANKAKEVAHELGVVQVHNLNNELRTLREKAIFQPGILGSATLTVSALLGNPIVTAAGALSTVGVAAKALVEQRALRRKHPAFFLWEVMERSRRM